IVITPRAFSSSLSELSLLSAPRGLNEPVFWNSSALKCSRTPMRSPSAVAVIVGVRCSLPAITRRAAAISSNPTRCAVFAGCIACPSSRNVRFTFSVELSRDIPSIARRGRGTDSDRYALTAAASGKEERHATKAETLATGVRRVVSGRGHRRGVPQPSALPAGDVHDPGRADGSRRAPYGAGCGLRDGRPGAAARAAGRAGGRRRPLGGDDRARQEDA